MLPLSWAGGASRQGREVTCHALFFSPYEHQFQQPNEGGTRPVLLMCSACSAVLAAARFLFSSAAARFSSALCLADASWVISLSCARARIRSTSTFRNTNHKPWLKLWIRLYKQCSIHKNGDKNIWTFTPWFYMFWTWTYITNWTKELNKSSSTTTLTRSVTSILTILYQNKQYFNWIRLL